MVGRRRLEALLARCWSRAVLCMGSAETSEQQGRRMRVVLGQRCLSSAAASGSLCPWAASGFLSQQGWGNQCPRSLGMGWDKGAAQRKREWQLALPKTSHTCTVHSVLSLWCRACAWAHKMLQHIHNSLESTNYLPKRKHPTRIPSQPNYPGIKMPLQGVKPVLFSFNLMTICHAF